MNIDPQGDTAKRWGLLTYSLVCMEVGVCRQVTLCKALH